MNRPINARRLLTSDQTLSRRAWLQLTATGMVGCSVSGWLEALANDAAGHPGRKRSCILLWMNGGPSQMDTFDLKPKSPNGGTFQPIETSVPGIRISEHLPKLARHTKHMAVVRSMTTQEGDHGRATFLLRTGYVQQGPIQYPTFGSSLSKEMGSDEAALPNFVSVAPYRFFNPAAYGPGFLGSKYAPLVVGDSNAVAQQPGQQDDYSLEVEDLELTDGVSRRKMDARLGLLKSLETRFLAKHRTVSPVGENVVGFTFYGRFYVVIE